MLCLFIYCRLGTSFFGSMHAHLSPVQMEWDSWHVFIDDCLVLYNTLQRNQNKRYYSAEHKIFLSFIFRDSHTVSILNNNIQHKYNDIKCRKCMYINIITYWWISINILFKFQSRKHVAMYIYFIISKISYLEYTWIYLYLIASVILYGQLLYFMCRVFAIVFK